MSEFTNSGGSDGPGENRDNQYLTFLLDDESYGINILKVEEIRGWEPVRDIPNTPPFIVGVLNLRGKAVPVVDLRIRFGLEQVEYTPRTVVIVLSVEANGEKHVIGVIADAVSEVLVIDDDELKQPPNLGAGIDTRYILGMVLNQKSVMLLDADKLLNPEEFSFSRESA